MLVSFWSTTLVVFGQTMPTMQTLPMVNQIGDNAAALSSAAVHAPIDLMGVVLAPFRDSYQLLPWNETPIEPATSSSAGGAASLLGSSSILMPCDIPDSKANWKYRVEGGGNFRYGNTTTNNINVALSAERRSRSSSLVGKFGATYNQLEGAETNRRFFGDATYDRFLRGRWIAYGKEELENDQIRRIDLRSITSVGLGYRLIDDSNARWIARTGPTFTYIQQRSVGADATTDTAGGWFLESEFRRIILGNSRVEWTASLFPNFASQQSLRLRNEIGLIFPVGSLKTCWNWKIGIRDEYTENPAPGTKPRDSEIYFAIVYASQ